jgi:hypothetical protein
MIQTVLDRIQTSIWHQEMPWIVEVAGILAVSLNSTKMETRSWKTTKNRPNSKTWDSVKTSIGDCWSLRTLETNIQLYMGSGLTAKEFMYLQYLVHFWRTSCCTFNTSWKWETFSEKKKSNFGSFFLLILIAINKTTNGVAKCSMLFSNPK